MKPIHFYHSISICNKELNLKIFLLIYIYIYIVQLNPTDVRCVKYLLTWRLAMWNSLHWLVTVMLYGKCFHWRPLDGSSKFSPDQIFCIFESWLNKLNSRKACHCNLNVDSKRISSSRSSWPWHTFQLVSQTCASTVLKFKWHLNILNFKSVLLIIALNIFYILFLLVFYPSLYVYTNTGSPEDK